MPHSDAAKSNDVLSLEQTLEAKLLQVSYDRLPMSLLLTLVLSAFFATLLWGHFPLLEQIIWLSAIFSVVLIRYLQWLGFKRSDHSVESIARWQTQFFIGTTLAGSAWGIGPILMQPETNSAGLSIFVTGMLAVCALAAITQASQQKAMQAFLFTALSPLIVIIWSRSSGLELILALMLVAALSTMLFISRRSYLSIHALFEAELQLRESENRYRAIVEWTPEAIVIHRAGKVIFANPSALKMFGASNEHELLGKPILELIHPDYHQFVLARIKKNQADGIPAPMVEEKFLKLDGTVIDVEIQGTAIEFDGKPAIQAALRDVTARNLAQHQLKKSEEQYRLIVDTANEGIVIAQDGVLKFVNRKLEQVTGYSAQELSTRPFLDIVHPDDKSMLVDMNVKRLKGEPVPERYSFRILTKEGNVRWCEMSGTQTERDGRPATFNFITDITERKQAEEEIYQLAFFDALTHLPNRRLLMDRLNSALAASERSQLYGAVLFLDMDRFKTLNDTLGHDHGDLLLIEVAKRIQNCVRAVDTTARLGGDEFVVILEEIDKNPEEAAYKIALIAEKIRLSLSSPYQLNQHEQHSSPSIGVCLFRGNEESADTLLKHADMAMYQVKDAGRNAVRFFDPAMQLEVETHAALEADLRNAVSHQQLQLHYQIQVNEDHNPIGAEALVRWNHPVRGLISPGLFIPIAEESSLILQIGNWVMETAIIQLGLWEKKDEAKQLSLAVNVSANQFKQHDFVEQVASLLRIHQVAASRLKLELTESVVLSDVTDVITKMHALKALGVSLSLDDFGTGYSSLSYLKRLPLDQIKIDQGFVRDIATDPNDAVMVQTIIDLARNFRLNAIAEGVETEAQRSFLARHGCAAYQGYLFGKPVSIEDFEASLQR